MPASEPIPTTDDLMGAFHAAIGIDNPLADANVGSMYDHWGSGGALGFKRLIERDQAEFRAIYFDTAPGSRLDTYVDQHFQETRVLGTVGTGKLNVVRSSSASGVFYDGTRVAVGGGTSEPLRYFVVDGDQDLGAALVGDVNIRATVTGPVGQLTTDRGRSPVLRFEDTLPDETWLITALTCGPGTTYQVDGELRSVIRAQRSDDRPGYPVAITQSMKAAGAQIVALFESNYLGDDLDAGLNRIYVGNTAYETEPALLTACRLAVSSSVVGGTAVQVLPMTNQLFYLAVTVRLWDVPSRFDAPGAQVSGTDAVMEYFRTRENPFVWRSSGIRAAIMRAVPNVHSVEISARLTPADVPLAEPVLLTLFDSGILKRWQVQPWTVSVTVVGPT